MSEFKGTPGPWMVDEYGDVKECNGDFLIAGCRGVIDVGKDEHNANLIAMSPELLGVLKEILRDNMVVHSQRVKANSIIAKALGESK